MHICLEQTCHRGGADDKAPSPLEKSLTRGGLSTSPFTDIQREYIILKTIYVFSNFHALLYTFGYLLNNITARMI